MIPYYTLGNIDILNHHKTAFICSRKCLADIEIVPARKPIYTLEDGTPNIIKVGKVKTHWTTEN